MPKREPTPPPAEDEPKYLAIIYPYPSMANMAIREDYLSLARWLACVMGPEGKDDLYAIFWKPSAPNMVLIEVAYHEEEWPGWGTLLGAHKWSEFSLEHDPGEGERISRIYYSTFRSGREVEKTGWRRIHIEDDWFVGWKPRNAKIAYPYPPSYWCDLPAEDQTAHRICKPIPKKLFQGKSAEPARGKPVVGSEQWAGKKEQASQPPAASASSSRPTSSRKSIPRYDDLDDDSPDDDDDAPPVRQPENDADREYRVIRATKQKWLDHGAKFSSVAEDAVGLSPREDFKCPSHGPLCKKGICADYKQYKRDLERAEERAEMLKKAAEQRARGGPFGRGRGGSSNGRGRGGHSSASGQSSSSSLHSGSSTPRGGCQGATSPPARGSVWGGRRGGPPRSNAGGSERGPSRAQSP